MEKDFEPIGQPRPDCNIPLYCYAFTDSKGRKTGNFKTTLSAAQTAVAALRARGITVKTYVKYCGGFAF